MCSVNLWKARKTRMLHLLVFIISKSVLSIQSFKVWLSFTGDGMLSSSNQAIIWSNTWAETKSVWFYEKTHCWLNKAAVHRFTLYWYVLQLNYWSISDHCQFVSVSDWPAKDRCASGIFGRKWSNVSDQCSHFDDGSNLYC